MPFRYSVIIPTYQEAPRISYLIQQLRTLNPSAQIIVVDANSADETVRVAQTAGADVYLSAPGRGLQCARGARHANGEILLFVHADSQLAINAFTVMDAFFSNKDCQVARFRLAFDQPHWLLKFYAWCSGFDSIFTRFGDQGIIVRRSFYERIGGMREWPLMEDVDFFRRARALAKITLLPARITASARKFVKTGMVRRQIFNGYLLVRYLLGASPEKLFKLYYGYPSTAGAK